MKNKIITNKMLNPTLTINKIVFNDGTEYSFNEDDIVVFVGANNVGKSRTLKDIKNDLLNSSTEKIIVKEVEYLANNFSMKSMKQYFDRNYCLDSNGNYIVSTGLEQSWSYNRLNFENINVDQKFLYKAFFVFLSTENRLSITSPISFSHVQDQYNLKMMNELEVDFSKIKKLNNILLSSFNMAIDIDQEYINNSYSKLYKFGTEIEIEKTINSNTRTAKQKLKKLENLHDQGDGIRSFVAILASLIVNEKSLYLLDEPETFLHPPQARTLGNYLVDLSKNKQCFISTHNIDLIRGLLEKKSSRVKIIKIDRLNNENKFSMLNNENLIKIAGDKNLKYSNILNGLFYQQIVLCESESDCKFYSAILESISNVLYQNTLFCAVGGKDQFKVVIPLLNNLSIKYKVIADLDLINNKSKLQSLLNSIDESIYNGIIIDHDEFLNLFNSGTYSLIRDQETIKKDILKLFTDERYMSDETANKIKIVLKNINNLKLLKINGRACLPPGLCVEKFNKIVDTLNDNNIYVVECGEIERFVPSVNSHGSTWVDEVFTRYPTINECEYDDAKKFIKKVFKIID